MLSALRRFSRRATAPFSPLNPRRVPYGARLVRLSTFRNGRGGAGCRSGRRRMEGTVAVVLGPIPNRVPAFSRAAGPQSGVMVLLAAQDRESFGPVRCDVESDVAVGLPGVGLTTRSRSIRRFAVIACFGENRVDPSRPLLSPMVRVVPRRRRHGTGRRTSPFVFVRSCVGSAGRRPGVRSGCGGVR